MQERNFRHNIKRSDIRQIKGYDWAMIQANNFPLVTVFVSQKW